MWLNAESTSSPGPQGAAMLGGGEGMTVGAGPSWGLPHTEAPVTEVVSVSHIDLGVTLTSVCQLCDFPASQSVNL